jgi:hypothetical protein
MAMRTDLVPPLLIGLLVAAAVAFGLAATGGPKAGRMEKRDETRLGDLHRVGDYVLCLADHDDRTLPADLTPDPICIDVQGRVRLADPFTGAPYRYERLDPSTFRICASFERYAGTEGTRYRSAGFDPGTGCLTRALPPA